MKETIEAMTVATVGAIQALVRKYNLPEKEAYEFFAEESLKFLENYKKARSS